MLPGTYAILENITVCAGDVLFLRPGEQVWVHKDKQVNIRGILEANGTASNDISVASYNISDAWGGFAFEPGSAGYFANCTIFGGLVGIYAQSSQVSIDSCSLSEGGTGMHLADHSVANLNNVTAVGSEEWGMIVNASSLVATGLDVRWSHKSGIYVSNESDFSGWELLVQSNGGGGLIAEKSTLKVRDSNISNNMYANMAISDSEIAIVNTAILDSYTGMYLDRSTVIIADSTVGGSDFGMRIDSSDVTISNSNLRDFESVYPPLAFDCSYSNVSIYDSRLVRAPITAYLGCNLMMERNYLEDGFVEAQGTSLFAGNEFSNYTIEFGTFTQARGNWFHDCDVALESLSLTTSIDDMPVHLDRNTITWCRVGLKTGMYSDQLVVFANGTFEGITESVADATNGGMFFIVNSSIGGGGFRGGPNRIYLARYLTVRTLKADGAPLADADIYVAFGGRTIWVNHTGDDGAWAWIPAPYAVYRGDGADPALQVGESVVRAVAPDTKFKDSPRNVNMTEARTEIFRAEVSEQQPFWLPLISIIAIIIVIVLIVLVIVLVLRRRRNRGRYEKR